MFDSDVEPEPVIDRPGLLPGHGKQAWDYCHRALPLEVLRVSSVGRYYIGTHCYGDGFNSRESVEYFKTSGEAQEALAAGTWTQREWP